MSKVHPRSHALWFSRKGLIGHNLKLVITEMGGSLLLSHLLLKVLPSAKVLDTPLSFRQVQTPGFLTPTGKQPRSMAEPSFHGFWGGAWGRRSLSDLLWGGSGMFPEQCNNPWGYGGVSPSFPPSAGEEEVVLGGLSPYHGRQR